MALSKIDTANMIDNVNLASNVTGTLPIANGGTNLSSGFVNGGVSSPAFHATNSGVQNLTSGSYTKVQFNTESYDDGGCYDHSSNYRFTPGETGKFLIYYRLGLITSAPAENKYPYIQYGRLYQDGGQSDALGELFIKRETGNYNYQEVYLHAAGVVNVTSASTYYELYALSTNAAGAGDSDVNTGSYFGAYKIIGI